MKAMIRFSILLFLVSGLQAVTAQTPTRLRLKQLELAPDTAYVIYSKDDGTAIWKAFSSVLSAGGGVTGSGTAGRVPRWTSSSALGDGVLRDDGTLLAIGGATVSGYSFYDYSTGGWRLATGTTAQRPTNAAGVHRYNTSLGYSETANGSAWLQSDLPVGSNRETLRHNGTSWVANSYMLSTGAYNQFGGASYSPRGSNTFYKRNDATSGAAIVAFNGTGGDNYRVINSDGTNLVTNGATSSLTTTTYPAIIGVGVNDSYVIRGFNLVGVLGVTGQSTGGNTADYIGVYGQAILNRTQVAATTGPHIGVYGLAGSTQTNLGTLGIYYGLVGVTYNWGAVVNSTGYGAYGASYLSTTNWGFYNPAGGGNNAFAGNTIIGGVSTPARTLHVTGEARITDLTTDTPTRIVGADADGDLGAVSEGYGINVTGGALEVDTTQMATQSDLAAISPTTLYTGDGTIATDRTVTVGSDKTLTITSTTPDFPGYSHTKKIGYNATWDLWGDYSLIYTDDYFTNFIQGIIDYDSTVFIRISAGDWGGDNYVNMQMNSAGVLSLTGISGSSSAGLSIGQNTTLGAYGSRLQGTGGVEFDADTAGKFVFQVNNTTEAVIDATGLGINDTSPEKSLDVGGMGKFRQISGQDNSVTIGTNANMGTGRSASITDSQSSDVAGRFSFTSGTGLTAGEWVTLTWGTAFDNPPAVVLMPEDANGASITPYLFVQPTTTGCSIQVNVTGAPYEGLTYSFNYIVIQGK